MTGGLPRTSPTPCLPAGVHPLPGRINHWRDRSQVAHKKIRCLRQLYEKVNAMLARLLKYMREEEGRGRLRLGIERVAGRSSVLAVSFTISVC